MYEIELSIDGNPIGTFDVVELPVVGGVYEIDADGDTWVYTEVTALDGDGSDYAVNIVLQ
jgi:hypothetical protein